MRACSTKNRSSVNKLGGFISFGHRVGHCARRPRPPRAAAAGRQPAPFGSPGRETARSGAEPRAKTPTQITSHGPSGFPAPATAPPFPSRRRPDKVRRQREQESARHVKEPLNHQRKPRCFTASSAVGMASSAARRVKNDCCTSKSIVCFNDSSLFCIT